MSENASLSAALREEKGKAAARRMRREGRIPAVIYGRGEETRELSVDAKEFDTLLRHYSLDTTLIELSIEGAKQKGPGIKALVSELQTHPFKAEVLHIDFHQIHAGERVHVAVPIHLTGTAEGVRDGGVLQHVMHEIELECAVENIPDALEVDVTGLDVGDSIHVSDLTLPEGVEIQVDPSRTVCTVAAPTVLEAPEEVEAEAGEPELVGVGGEVEEGETEVDEAAEDESEEA